MGDRQTGCHPVISLDCVSHKCHITHVTLFRFSLRPGESIFDQVVYAAKKAFISGEFQPGQPFPSVRALAAELKIHPNTAHKVVQYLIQERWLEARHGIGTVVAKPPEARAGDRKKLLQQEVEQLVVEAKRVGADLDAVLEAIENQWARIERMAEVSRE
jgi:GntR family transcriptional regulator